MLDNKRLEKSALQQLLEYNTNSKMRRTFQEKFNRFNEIHLKNWEEEGKSESSFILQKEKKERTNTLPKSTPFEKKPLFKLQTIFNNDRVTKNTNRSRPNESNLINSKTKLEYKASKLNRNENKTISSSFLDKNRFPSPEENIYRVLQSNKFKEGKNNKKPFDLKIISPPNKNASLLFLNDFNDNMLKNRQNFSPSNFKLLNFKKNPMVNFKHLKIRSVGNKFPISNNMGMLENKQKESNEKEKAYRVLHSLHSMKFFNFN